MVPFRAVVQRSFVIIGRQSGCDVELEHPTVSGRHARLSWEGDRILVEDLGISDELAEQICTAAGLRAREVEVEREREAAQAAARAAEDAAATAAILGSEGAAVAATPDAEAESAADSILGFGRSGRADG